ncbi:hypothetical protein DFH06DRAFT_1241843 [Mycena polygramma]|nr:hypothetical protein DFH06DRAFT_1241843 [Mycena polygramma]
MATTQTHSRSKNARTPFIDASNRTATKHHAHLRTLSAPSPPKSPPTCTVSLAHVTTSPALSISTAVPLPTQSPRALFPSDDADANSWGEGSCTASPEPWRRPRARTSHVRTPRRAQPPSTPTRRISEHPRTSATPSPDAWAPRPAPTASDLRLAALLERSIALHLTTRPIVSDLDSQDVLLASRLRAFLALHGCGSRPSSPTTGAGFVPAPCAPSVLLSGSTGAIPSPLPVAASAPLRFITSRARSGSRGSVNSTATLSMPALVATLLLRRHEGGRITLTRDAKRKLSPSPLGVHFFSS